MPVHYLESAMLLCIYDNAQLKSEEYYINLIRFCQFDRVVVSQKSPIHIHVVHIQSSKSVMKDQS